MFRLLAMLLCLALPVQAQTVRVSSGEHADFSRLVLELPAAYGWQLGRTPDGYALALQGASPQFDVSTVFNLIPKDRLIGIFVDPASGHLRLKLDCDCHAMPFSLDARTIVIDLRDGPAPAGSSFEAGMDGVILPPLKDSKQGNLRPRTRGEQAPAPQPQYDWLSLGPTPALPVAAFPMPDEVAQQSGTLRETLVAQLADGASRNVIDLALQETPGVPESAPYLPDSVPVRLTNRLGLQIGEAEENAAPLQPDGETCLPDDQIAVEGWVTEEALATPYAGLGKDLVGEFDKPQAAAVTAAAQRYIYLGFGAEARALLNAFADQSTDHAMLRDMSYLVDGDPVPETHAFAGMAECDTAAAFWALLADGGHSNNGVNTAAIKRTFSALPPHLRHHLGPMVVDALLAIRAHDVATEIAQAMKRGMPEDSRAMALAQSELLLAEGKPAEALPQVEEVLADPGQLKAEALITLVDVQIAANNPIDASVAETLEAMLVEYEGHPLHADMDRAYDLALAGSGQFAAARARTERGAVLLPAFWKLLALNADDDTLLLQAMQPPANPEGIPPEAGSHIATRLAGLGFSDAADEWHALFPDAAKLMATSTFADEGSPPHPAITDPETAPVLDAAEATPATAPPDNPQTTLAEPAAAEVPSTVRAARWNEDWASVAAAEDGTWTALASRLNAQGTAEDQPTLAAANETLAQSQEVRALITNLLAETQENPAGP